MMEPVYSNTVKGKTLNIYQDFDEISPRENDNLTKIVTFHKKYNLGDSQEYYKSENYNSFDELKADITRRENPLVILPLYLYDHSGITISTTPFSCPWDSGQIGFVYITNDKINTLDCSLNNDESWEDYLKRLTTYLKSEIKIYDHYLTGDVYRFELLNEFGETIDNCCGFFGTDWKNNGLSDYVDSDLIESL